MKKCVVIYTEGETDDEFYKKVLSFIKNKIPGNKFSQSWTSFSKN